MDENQTQQKPGIDLDTLQREAHQLVLIVDDDSDTNVLLKSVLKFSGFNVSGALSGKDALEKTAYYHPDLILLDLMMPEMDGFETLQKLRSITNVPVVILSALSEKDKIVQGLRMGADDYITKPFNNDELAERIRAVLRRAGRDERGSHFEFEDVGLVIDIMNHTVKLQGQEIDASPKEFEMLVLLARQAPNMVDYPVIATTLWGKDDQDVRNRLKYLVYLLRNKLKEAAPGLDLIKNINRLVYKLDVEH